MGKLIVASLMFPAGLFMCFTGVGIIVGIPLIIGSLGMGLAGMASLTKTTVKAGIKGGQIVNEMQKASAERAALSAEAQALAEERAKLEAEKQAWQEANGVSSVAAETLSRPTPKT